MQRCLHWRCHTGYASPTQKFLWQRVTFLSVAASNHRKQKSIDRTMQSINTIQQLKTTSRQFRTDGPVAGFQQYAIYIFCFLQLSIPMTAGYLVTRSELSSSTKLLLLGLACLASVLLLFQYINGSSHQSETSIQDQGNLC